MVEPNENEETNTSPVNTLVSNDLTSDILIYNLLFNSTDPWIKKCNLKFIDRSVPALEDDTIYVANIDLETSKDTFHSTEYKALVNIYIKTKQTDYLEGSRFLRTVAKHIKDLIKTDVNCKRRHAFVRNISYEYGSKYTLKGMHMIIQLKEHDKIGEDPVILDEVCFEEVDVEIKND